MTQREQQPARLAGGDVVLAEHCRLHEVIASVRTAGCGPAVVDRFRELQAFSARHFEMEEQEGGFYASVLEQAPRHAGALDELRAEHGVLLADIERLSGDLAQADDASRGEVVNHVVAVLERMLVHEARENDLLTEVMNTDLGAGD